MTGMQGVGALAALLAVVLVLRRRRTRRRPTRAMADMDHDVHERIRAISAESRYSSAGYEF